MPFKDWEKRLHKTITKKFSRSWHQKIDKAKILALNYIENFRKFGSQRLKISYQGFQ